METYFLDVSDGVVSRHGEIQEDPGGQQEVHEDLLVSVLLPLLQRPILPRGHGDGLSFTVSSPAAGRKTTSQSEEVAAKLNMIGPRLTYEH